MKRSTNVKFPNSVQLFKFCQKILMFKKGGKVRDQEVGSILSFNPSDCSHWKRGEKNVRSVFALAKLAETLQVEPALIHDVASGIVSLDEAFYEYLESHNYQKIFAAPAISGDVADVARQKVLAFVAQVQKDSNFVTPPLYLPEVMRTFAFVATQPVDMLDKLSRILRIKPGTYCIQFKKGELKPQTRMSMTKDLARIVLEGERARFPELGPAVPELFEFEKALFAANLLVPREMLVAEMSKLDSRRNVVSELAGLFWVPKSLICFQLQDILRQSTLSGEKGRESSISTTKIDRAATV